MSYHTLLIKIAGQTQTYVHFAINPFRSVCGQTLNTQFKLEYDLEENELCPDCSRAKTLPSLKDWTFTKPIKTKKQAFQSLSCLYIYYQMLGKGSKICQMLEECDNFGNSYITTFLTDADEPKIEKIENGKVEISYCKENTRVKKTVSYQRVGMIMKNVKKDLLAQLQTMRN